MPAPRRAPARPRRSASATSPDPASTTRAPCASTSTARPVTRPVDGLHGHLGAERRAGVAVASQRRATRPRPRRAPRRARRAAHASSVDAVDRHAGQVGQRRGAVRDLGRHLRATPVDVDADPDHGRGDLVTVDRRLDQQAADLRAVGRHEVVRPLEVDGATCCAQAVRAARAAATASCQASPAASARPQRHAERQVPARWRLPRAAAPAAPRRLLLGHDRAALAVRLVQQLPGAVVRRADARVRLHAAADPSAAGDRRGASRYRSATCGTHDTASGSGQPRSVRYTRRRHEPDPRRP